MGPEGIPERRAAVEGTAASEGDGREGGYPDGQEGQRGVRVHVRECLGGAGSAAQTPCQRPRTASENSKPRCERLSLGF